MSIATDSEQLYIVHYLHYTQWTGLGGWRDGPVLNAWSEGSRPIGYTAGSDLIGSTLAPYPTGQSDVPRLIGWNWRARQCDGTHWNGETVGRCQTHRYDGTRWWAGNLVSDGSGQTHQSDGIRWSGGCGETCGCGETFGRCQTVGRCHTHRGDGTRWRGENGVSDGSNQTHNCVGTRRSGAGSRCCMAGESCGTRSTAGNCFPLRSCALRRFR